MKFCIIQFSFIIYNIYKIKYDIPAQNALPAPDKIIALHSDSVANSLKQILNSLYNH